MRKLQPMFFRNLLRTLVALLLVSYAVDTVAKSPKRSSTAVNGTTTAARYLLINTAVLKQVVESAAITRSSIDIIDDIEADAEVDDEESTDDPEQDPTPLVEKIDKKELAASSREVRESISFEINYTRSISREMPIDAAEFQRLIEPENWAEVNNRIKLLSRMARKRLPSLTRRLKSGHFVTWARAMLPPIEKSNASTTELFDAFIEFRHWLDEFDPLLTIRQQREAQAKELIDAIHANDRERVEKLVNSAIPISASEFPIAESPIVAALSTENESLLQFLILKGALIEPLDRLSALEVSASDYPGLFNRLLAGAEFPYQHRINDKIRNVTDLLVKKRRTLEMKQWIATINDITRLQNEFGDSYLFELVEAKDIEFLRIFLDAGANPNVDSRHVSLLRVALATRDLATIELLLDHKVDLQKPFKTNSRETAFEAFLLNTDFAPEDWPLILRIATASTTIFADNQAKAKQVANKIAQQTSLPVEYVLGVLRVDVTQPQANTQNETNTEVRTEAETETDTKIELTQ